MAQKEKEETKKDNVTSQPEKERFRLKFNKDLQLGRSTLSYSKLLETWGPVVTPKFYSNHDILPTEDDENVRVIIDEISKARCFGPMEKYEEPILESHRYGWFQEKSSKFNVEMEKPHFPKRTSEMVKIQNLLYNFDKAEQLYNQTKAKEKSN